VASLAGVLASVVPLGWPGAGLGAEAGNMKASWAVLASAGAAARTGTATSVSRDSRA